MLRLRLFWYRCGTVIKFILVAIIVLIAIIAAIWFATRERNEIAPALRIYYDIDDVVVMNIRSISDDIVEIDITNNSNVYLLFGYSSFSIEHFDSRYWRALPYRRSVTFLGAGLLISPNGSFAHRVNFETVYHSPRHGDLYRIRLTTSVARGRDSGLPPHPTAVIHDIVAEFSFVD